jgi:hypothetical protein
MQGMKDDIFSTPHYPDVLRGEIDWTENNQTFLAIP